MQVRGGNNPHSAENYHPLIITDEPVGGYDRLSDDAQKAVRVLAGVEFSRRGQPRPTAGQLTMIPILPISKDYLCRYIFRLTI